ncbi:hypothetical protein [Actinoplanes teichomyceticus]|uniref:Uncharacterized protein n=1 Tax=Actinoplanes teichomyceticus TaxID=1867 RepID=A0A561WAU7_ACTTI|nr:hypothetical protein [Actinoplanes teichomyceticus]TWG20980.1 hypothetical protein FHX34_103509 [Actinoplanes teichomyceticus]GIF14800.1 hypothetical protein Ate01nite_48320 [Actinoplanes teichomyceticus]
MTPERARQVIALYAPTAQADPEAWHSVIDDLRKEALKAIEAGHEHPAELAAAVLEADAIPVAWTACA